MTVSRIRPTKAAGTEMIRYRIKNRFNMFKEIIETPENISKEYGMIKIEFLEVKNSVNMFNNRLNK